ncbi:MAG: cation:proton antiporter [Rickettsia sp.]|nr:cation:proton antiporter [Rickettsia sp.]
MIDNILLIVIILIAFAVLIIGIFEKLNLSPVLGYLISGVFIGEHGLNLVSHSITEHFGEFGVVFLLFVIGLELSFDRLKTMRKYVFGLGTLQVLVTFFVIFIITRWIFFLSNKASVIIAGGLSLSSTAIVMQSIFEKKMQSLQVGRIAISILILQDLAVIPLLIAVPLLSNEIFSLNFLEGKFWINILIKGTLVISIIIIIRSLLRPVFKFFQPQGNENSELAIAMTFLIVLFSAWGMSYFGLSYALGGFIAGILVAETDFRKKAEHSIEPFKNLLLGLFFMSVGMQIEPHVYSKIHIIFSICILLIVVKATIITLLCVLFKFHYTTSIRSGLLLSQGGEFAFILFNMGANHNLLDPYVASILLSVITCSMALTPLLALLGNKLVESFETNMGISPLQIIEKSTRDLNNHVIIAGFGKVGKIATKVLEAEEINNYIIVEIKDYIVNKEKKDKVIFQGDISNPTFLNAIGIERASVILLTMRNEFTIKKFLKQVNNFDSLDVIIRLRDLKKSKDFYDLGANLIIPQDYEMGLQLGNAVLKYLGVSEYEITRIKKQFRSTNYLGKTSENIMNIE